MNETVTVIFITKNKERIQKFKETGHSKQFC